MGITGRENSSSHPPKYYYTFYLPLETEGMEDMRASAAKVETNILHSILLVFGDRGHSSKKCRALDIALRLEYLRLVHHQFAVA